MQLSISNRQILAISLPISFALVIPFLNFTVNNFFLGRLGESELGTAGITGVYFLVMAVIGNGLNNSLQAIISRRAGEDRPAEIGRTFGQGVKIALLFAAAGIVLTYLLAPLLFAGSLAFQGVEQRAVEFLKIRVWGLPFLYLFQMGNALLVGTTNSRLLIIGTLFEAGANILLDYLLIFGHCGFPQLGFNGAAWASVFAEAIGMAVVILVIFFKKMHVQFELFRHFSFNREVSRLILKTSAPLIGQYGISLISWLFFYILIEHKGERSLAISNIMRNVFTLTGVFTWAFASTTNTMVSNIIGQNRKEEVLVLIQKIMRLSFLFAVILVVILNVFASSFLNLFGLSQEFTEAGVPVLRMVTAGILLMSISVVWLNGVTGTGNTQVNLLIELAAIVFYCVYVYLVLEVYNLNLIWAWASELIYWLVIVTMAFLYIQSGRWKEKRL